MKHAISALHLTDNIENIISIKNYLDRRSFDLFYRKIKKIKTQ